MQKVVQSSSESIEWFENDNVKEAEAFFRSLSSFKSFSFSQELVLRLLLLSCDSAAKPLSPPFAVAFTKAAGEREERSFLC